MNNSNEFETIIENLKKYLTLSKDIEIARLLGITSATYSDRKKRNSIPYEKIIEICKINKISIDKLFENDKNSNIFEKKETYQEKLDNTLKKLSEKESKYYYYLIEAELAKKEL